MHNDMLKVESETRLLRDPVSRAIINTDDEGYNAYINRREKRRAMENALAKHDDDINNIKQELGDIKQMLSILVANIQNREN